MAAIRGNFRSGTGPYFLYCYQLAMYMYMYQVSFFYRKMHDSSQNCYISAPLIVCGGSVFFLCFGMLPFWFCNHLDEEEKRVLISLLLLSFVCRVTVNVQ